MTVFYYSSWPTSKDFILVSKITTLAEGDLDTQIDGNNLTSAIQAMVDDSMAPWKKTCAETMPLTDDTWTGIKWWIENDKYKGTYDNLACIWIKDMYD